MNEFETLSVSVSNKVAYAQINRPNKANAMNKTLWFELGELADWAAQEPSVRVLVLSGNGKHFTAGIDFSLVQSLFFSVAKEPQGLERLLF